ncbi:MAG: protein-methionine-sulfoxide reductase heme-binding subunit MsrQ [Rhodobacterales bacterium]|nr:protein-methionine-sulfoxide reductase heme-binding subunit MsrQ [Rhodobacterales bacterium]
MSLADAVNAAARRVPVRAVYALGLVPLALLVGRGVTGDLGVDPVKTIEHDLGLRALQFLLLGLCITPLRRFAGVNLLRFRRALGLTAFLYVALHLAVWLLLDLQLRWSEIGADLVKRPYIVLGMAGFAVLVPLALTSTDSAVRRMGAAAWRRLHRLTYAAVLLGAAHYLILVKAWPIEPILYALAAVALVLLRLWPSARRRVAAQG